MDERRLHRRTLVDARVVLYHSSFSKMQGRTRDISDGGVFVVLDNATELKQGALIKMVMLESPNKDIIFNMSLVRQVQDGVALRFIDYEVEGKRYSMDELREMWQQQI